MDDMIIVTIFGTIILVASMIVGLSIEIMSRDKINGKLAGISLIIVIILGFGLAGCGVAAAQSDTQNTSVHIVTPRDGNTGYREVIVNGISCIEHRSSNGWSGTYAISCHW